MTNPSAGLLLFRRHRGNLEVLLVHPGGPFWAKKDDGAWSIPKGEVAPGEDPRAAALREFEEELGSPAGPPTTREAGTTRPDGAPGARGERAGGGDLLDLGTVRQKGGKQVTAWALEADFACATVRSNTFEMEWPPRSGRMRSFPEIDRAEWFDLEMASRKINPAQVELLERLASRLGAP